MAAGMKSGRGDKTWTVGKWEKHKGELSMCKSGFHASIRAIDAMQYVNCEILALVEVRGKHLKQDDKQCWSEMCVVRAYRWEKPDSVALAIYAAELVIGNYEKRYPDDKRPREAIGAAKKWLNDPTEENRSAARSVARSAAHAAADAAHAAYAAAHAAHAAAYAAHAAAYAAHAAAYAAAHAADAAPAAGHAAGYAAHAAYAADAAAYAAAYAAALDDIEVWIQEHIKTLKEVSHA
jgi:hypothetical protein